MPNIDHHPPGTFCWIELGTSDQDAAQQFYNSLLGWTATDSPMGPGASYTTFALKARKLGGGYNVTKMAPGIPSHWMIYVCSDDVDATAAKATDAGGKLMCPPMDVMDFGRMVVMQDPSGAHISVWQPKSHLGFEIEREPGSMTWADLMTPEPEKAQNFYEAVFGWRFDLGQDSSGYLHIKSGDEFIGGMPPAKVMQPGVPPHWLLYIDVENCDDSTAKAKQLGAKVYYGPTTMEKVGRWSVISDPQGATFALFQPERR